MHGDKVTANHAADSEAARRETAELRHQLSGGEASLFGAASDRRKASLAMTLAMHALYPPPITPTQASQYEKWHCESCIPYHGPSIYRTLRVGLRKRKRRINFAQLDDPSLYMNYSQTPSKTFCDHSCYCLFCPWSQGGGGRGSGHHTLCSERRDLQLAERANASEASERSRKRAVVYLKLGTRQTK